MKKINALIVEDIQEAAAALKADIADRCPEVAVAGCATSVVAAARMIKEVNPDLLFLDIEMGDGDGFDLLDIVPDQEPMQVIFTTASRKHALKAFRYAAVDYLLKPVDPDELAEAVSRAIQRLKDKKPVSELREELGRPDRIALSMQDEIRLINTRDILRCMADGNYTQIFITGNRKLIVSATLKTIEGKLEGKGFVRVHQSHLVNFEKVRAFLREEGGYLELENGDRIPVSTRKKALVLKKLDQYL